MAPDEPWDDAICWHCGRDLPDEDPDPENTGAGPWWEGYCSEQCRKAQAEGVALWFSRPIEGFKQ